MAQPQLEMLIEEVYGAWRFRWSALVVAWVVGVIGWALVFLFWHNTYQGSARVFVDTRTALKPVLEGLAVAQDVDAQLNYVRQSLLGTPQLEKVGTEAGLFGDTAPGSGARAKLIEELRDRIIVNVRPASDAGNERMSGGNVYWILYKDRTREKSLKVVQSLLKMLVQETLGGKIRGSEDAQKFMETQIKDYELRLRAAEQRLADFKKANVGVMPTQQGDYFGRLQTEMEATRATEAAIDVAATRREEINRQLHGEAVVNAATVNVNTPGTKETPGVAGGDVPSRIRETQAKLDELLLKFTDKHPDVIAARETLEELKRRRDAEVEALRNGDSDAAAISGASANPIYQSLQLALNQTEVELATLRQQLNGHRAHVAELRRALDTMPQVEAQYSQLNRDYDVNKTQFTALLTQLEKAKLGQEADSSGSVRFDVIEPPNVGYRPVPPSRSLLSALVLVVALAAGAVFAYLRNMLQPVFWSPKRLAAKTDVPVLGTVTGAFPDALGAIARQDLLRYSLAAGALLFIAMATITINVLGSRLVSAG